MTRGRGQRRGPAGSGDAVKTALEKWRTHSKHCSQCHAAAGHPGSYCNEGWLLASAVSQARAAARATALVRARNQSGLW